MIIPHWPIYTGPNKDFSGSIERTKNILSQLNQPQNRINNVIHITGTKGKGSTALYISNILLSCGYKVNTYTSPHIFECNERLLINGNMVSDEELLEATEAVRFVCENRTNIDNIEPSMFEAMTCSAFLLMAQHKADFNIIEVGMGAINDATNVFDDNPPAACVFTPIHVDHAKYLGNTVNDVAYNKSFLMKKGVKSVVLSSQCKEVQQILQNVAKKMEINDVFSYKQDYEVFFNENNLHEPVYESKTFDTCFPFRKPNMSGDYQFINCACAITTCLSCVKNNLIDKLTLDAINDGIAKTVNIVRMQQITNDGLIRTLPTGSLFYVDGAHNQLASHALAEWIRDFRVKNRDFKVVVAVARTKGADNEAFLKEFLNCGQPIIDLLIATRANLESIPEPPEKIEESGRKLNFNVVVAHSIKEVLEQTGKYCDAQKTLLICTGSLYIARDINAFNNF